MVLQIPPIVYPTTPVTNVQPFTFKDGSTFLERLERITQHINKAIIPWLEENIDELTEDFKNQVNSLISSVNNLANAVINDGIELQDEVLTGILSRIDSDSREILDTIYANKSYENRTTDLENLTNAGRLSETELNATIAGDLADPESVIGSALKDTISELAIQVREAPPTPYRFGALGSGEVDDHSALTAMLSSDSKTFTIPPGVYRVDQPLVVTGGKSLLFSKGARIKAGATMSSVMQIGTTSSRSDKTRIENAFIDANGMATDGVHALSFARLVLSSPSIKSPLRHGIRAGDPSLPSGGAPYELVMNDAHIYRDYGEAVPTGSRGIWVETATDNEFNVANIVGFDIGVRVDTPANRFIQMHPWGYGNALPKTAFEDAAPRNTWAFCEADTPSQHGWRLFSQKTVILGGRVFNNSFGADGQLVGVYAEYDNPEPAYTAFGVRFQAQDISHRLLADFGGPGNTLGATIVGCDSYGVINVASSRLPVSDMYVRELLDVRASAAISEAFRIRANNGSKMVSVDTGSQLYQLGNGMGLSGWAGDYATETFRLSSASGFIQPGSVTGVGSRVYSGAGVPSISAQDGSVWIRTDGTTGAFIYHRRAGVWVASGA